MINIYDKMCNSAAMQKVFNLSAFMVLFFSMGVFTNAEAQTITVEPDNYPVERGNLNKALEDNAAEGVIFELKRDAVYWLDSEPTIEAGMGLVTIQAEAGEGDLPIIRPAVDENFVAPRHFRSFDDLTLKDIYLSGLDDQGFLVGNSRAFNEGTRITLENVWTDYDRCILWQLESDGISIFIKDNKMRNSGRKDNINCGRLIDTRGNDIDSLVVENSTFYTNTQFPIRTDGGAVNYMKIDHSTFVDTGYHLEMGRVKELVFTNNLLMSIGWRGNGGEESVGMADQSILTFMTFEDNESFDDMDRNIVIRNNNLGNMRPEYANVLQSFFDAGIAAGQDSVALTGDPIPVASDDPFIHDQLIDSVGQKLMDMGVLIMENNITESEADLQFTSRPDVDTIVNYLTAFITDRGDQNLPMPWDRFNLYDNGDNENPPYSSAVSADAWRDFSYNSSSLSYIAGIDGFPLGDLNYFPDLKQQWEDGDVITSNESDNISVPAQFKLVGNYPNPFNPTTNIEFQLAQPLNVTMTVYNAIGQRVDKIDLGTRSAGTQSVTYDASNLVSGMYMVRMKAGNITQTIKMTLVK